MDAVYLDTRQLVCPTAFYLGEQFCGLCCSRHGREVINRSKIYPPCSESPSGVYLIYIYLSKRGFDHSRGPRPTSLCTAAPIFEVSAPQCDGLGRLMHCAHPPVASKTRGQRLLPDLSRRCFVHGVLRSVRAPPASSLLAA